MRVIDLAHEGHQGIIRQNSYYVKRCISQESINLLKRLVSHAYRAWLQPQALGYTGARCVRKTPTKKLYNTTRGRTHLLPFF